MTYKKKIGKYKHTDTDSLSDWYEIIFGLVKAERGSTTSDQSKALSDFEARGRFIRINFVPKDGKGIQFWR